MGGFLAGRRGGNACRILVVEDDQATRHLLLSVLDDAGYDARWAANGKDAIDTLPEWPPDLILLDLMMPVMDGYEFYSRLRKIPGEHPPVIVVSAVAPRQAELPGVHAIVAKPFVFTQLLHRVEAAAMHGAVST
jgi:two-component system, chemotaxis family, chemotaxis protein CheY